jgi:ferredoxin
VQSDSKPPVEATLCKVVIGSTGEVFWLPRHAHLVDALELGVAGLIFGCRAGACGICVIEVTEGMENLSRCEANEAGLLEALGFHQQSMRLACQCRLHGDIVINHPKPAAELSD